MAKRMRRFAGLRRERRFLLLEAGLLLLASRVAVALCPFRFLRRGLGAFEPPAGPAVGSCEEDAAIAREVRWAIASAARHLPLDLVCLPQAIAAQMLLRRRRVSSLMHFGVALETERKLRAHAWLEAAGIGITGYPVAPDFSELGCFRCE